MQIRFGNLTSEQLHAAQLAPAVTITHGVFGYGVIRSDVGAYRGPGALMAAMRARKVV